MQAYITTRRVEFSDTDLAGIAHFANFFRWMEQAEHEFFRSIGLNIMNRTDDTTVLGWPRVSCSCSYESPAHYEDELQIHLRLDRIGVKSLTFLIEFFHTGKRLAHGRMKTACCLCRPGGKLQSIEIPESYLKLLRPFEIPHADSRPSDPS